MRFPGWLTLLTAVAAVAASKPEFDAILLEDQKIAMRDGVHLSADIFLPGKAGSPAPGKFPVIVYRTPYNKAGLRTMGQFLAARGYAMVAQDVRGRFKSEGDFYAFVQEGPDGYDTIEWAGTQSWSNGKVGTAGGSYLAWDQYLAAMQRPPHLAAMYAEVGGNIFYDEFAHPGGAPNPAWGVWILASAASSPQALADPALRAPLLETQKNVMTWLSQPPEKRADIFANFPAHRKMFLDFYGNPSFNDYWKQKGFYTAAGWNDIKDIPIFFLSGWYDYFGEGLLENFASLARSQKTPKRLWMGPWPHGLGRAECGSGNFGPDAAIQMREVMLDWFDFWLKSDPLEHLGPERVRYFRMGGGTGERDSEGRIVHGGQWLTADFWPPRGLKHRKYYLQGGGALAPSRPPAGAPSTISHDPASPVPTTGGRYNMVPGIKSCVQDQAALDARSDVLRFQTPALADPVDITGRVTAKVWVASDAEDADVAAKLIDVYPDGFAVGIADGVLRLRNRNGRDRPSPVKPGEAYLATIDLGSVSNLVAKGHRIRVDISSSNYPRVEPNPRKARNAIYHDTLRASYVELPVLPAAR